MYCMWDTLWPHGETCFNIWLGLYECVYLIFSSISVDATFSINTVELLSDVSAVCPVDNSGPLFPDCLKAPGKSDWTKEVMNIVWNVSLTVLVRRQTLWLCEMLLLRHRRAVNELFYYNNNQEQ